MDANINNQFCHGEQGWVEGYTYNCHANAYLIGPHKTNLNLDYEENSYDMINAVKAHDKNIPLVTVIVSGNPMVVNWVIDKSDTFIAVWLPDSGGVGEFGFNSNP